MIRITNLPVSLVVRLFVSLIDISMISDKLLSIHERRSISRHDQEGDDQQAGDIVDPDEEPGGAHVRNKRNIEPLIRNKRHSKHYIGPVYTYVKTDKHARYKWGVKHKVGKHHG